MKLIFFAFVVACFFYDVVAEKEQVTTPPQRLADFNRVKNSLQTKTELVGRFFKLLTSGSAELENPRVKSGSPYISKSFRRLNIFGFQAPPDEPQRDSEGKPVCDQKRLVPDILHVTNKPEVSKHEPIFSVVWPQSGENSFQKSIELSETNQHQHYPKLDLDALFEQPQGTAERQPFSYQYQSSPQ
jgi:hypothetical protein